MIPTFMSHTLDKRAGCDVRGRMIFLDLRVTGVKTRDFASEIGFQGWRSSAGRASDL